MKEYPQLLKLWKANKEIEEMVKNNNYQEFLSDNENVLKSYLMEKSVLPSLKRKSKMPIENRPSIFRIDTLGAMNNLIHQKQFISDLK